MEDRIQKYETSNSFQQKLEESVSRKGFRINYFSASFKNHDRGHTRDNVAKSIP